MTTIKQVVAIAALIATPMAAFAQAGMQSDDSLTRAQVRQDQMQVNAAGYNPSIGDQAWYPRQAQAAEARVGAQQVNQAASGGYGGVMPGTTASGAPERVMQPAHTGEAAGAHSIYFGH